MSPSLCPISTNQTVSKVAMNYAHDQTSHATRRSESSKPSHPPVICKCKAPTSHLLHQMTPELQGWLPPLHLPENNPEKNATNESHYRIMYG